jgi:two-component system, sensor histidine kinase
MPAAKLLPDLPEADRARNVYLATVAHEMRNALAPLLNATDLVDSLAGDIEGVAQVIPMARRQIRQLVTLTDDLLDVGRALNNEFRMTFRNEGAQELVKQVIEAWRRVGEQKRQTISLDMPTQLVRVQADRVRFSQALQNILSNAIKFTPEGGRIAVRMHAAEPDVQICVSDSGIGIAPAELENVFNLFYRVREPGTSAGGFGVGLAVAQHLIQRHGGRIFVRSQGLGQGTSVTIALPIAGHASGETT